MKSKKYKFPWSGSELAKKINEILGEYNVPLTLRQVYYRLVSVGLLNAQKAYKNLSSKLSRLREQDKVSWNKIIDLNRQPRKISSWICPEEFFETVSKSYRRDLQQEQPKHIEVWCEKAVAIRHITDKYGLSLLAGGGYRSSSALYEASERFANVNKPTVILYLGDFDPSGLDIERDVEDRMREVFCVEVSVQRVLLLSQDITDYKLEPSPVKIKDVRTPAYVAKYGFKNAYELDALPPNIIADRLEKAICDNMNMELFQTQATKEETDNKEIGQFIRAWNMRGSYQN